MSVTMCIPDAGVHFMRTAFVFLCKEPFSKVMEESQYLKAGGLMFAGRGHTGYNKYE